MKRSEIDALCLGPDAEKHFQRQRQVARKRPQHVGGVELGVNVAVVKVEILLVGGEKGCRTEHRA